MEGLSSTVRLSEGDADNLFVDGSGELSFFSGVTRVFGNLASEATLGDTGRGTCGAYEGEGFVELAVDAGREPKDDGTDGEAPFCCGGAR